MSRDRRRQRRRTVMSRGQVRQERQTRRQFRQRLLRWFYVGVVGFVGLLIILGLALPSVLPFGGVRGDRSGDGPGLQVASQGTAHIPQGQQHVAYNTSPPTSGPHYDSTVEWGISRDPIVDELQIHNLELGGVLVQYNSEDTALIDQLETLVQSQRNYPCYLIVAPYTNMDSTIALTAWGVIQYLDAYDEQAILDFTDAYRDRGPERVPCTP